MTRLTMYSPAGRHFIAAEYVDGLTLRQSMELTQMTLGEKLGVALQVAGALAKAHAAGIVHRDIKPGCLPRAHSRDILPGPSMPPQEPLHAQRVL